METTAPPSFFVCKKSRFQMRVALEVHRITQSSPDEFHRRRGESSDWAFKLMMLHGLQTLNIRIAQFAQESHPG